MNLLDKEQFQDLISTLISSGYESEISWSRNIEPCNSSYSFAMEAVWVILNSGMKNQIAQVIWDRIREAWSEGKATSSAFKHKGKVAAIDYILDNREELFQGYQGSPDKVSFLKSLPWIGPITCWHLAKNLGHDVVKPDRWLVRIAKQYDTTPDLLCEQISKATGEKKHTIDLIIWRACNLGILKAGNEQKDRS